MPPQKTTRNRTSPKKVVVVHSCNQEANLKIQSELLKRISDVTLGNGHPEDGLLFRFRRFMEEHVIVMDDIKEIKAKLSSVNEINTELEIQRRVKVEKEKFLKDFKLQEDKRDDKEHKKKSIRWQTIGVVASIVSIALIALFSILNYDLNRKTKNEVSTVNTRVEDLGTPVILNKNGKPIDSRGFELKMYPKDFNDTINKNDIIKK